MALQPGTPSDFPRLVATDSALPSPPSGPNVSLNGSWTSPTEHSSLQDLAATGALGAVLSAMGLVGMVGNLYTLVVACRFLRASAPLYAYVVSLALADLLYLLGIPFIVATYVSQDWRFGDAGCRVLFSLDFLTMHASVFTLTAMSRERCAAVLRPLHAMRRSGGSRKVLVLGTWLLALLLTLPMALAIRLARRGPKSLCLPAWGPQAHRAYLTLLFGTSMVAPGLVIGLLYVRLAWAYWRSQQASFRQTQRLPSARMLGLILGIVLLFWACFLPFWLWQLLAQYRPALPLAPRTVRVVNFLTTCLTYGNSCVNPFLYTLLSRSYREHLRSRRPRGAPGAPRATQTVLSRFSPRVPACAGAGQSPGLGSLLGAPGCQPRVWGTPVLSTCVDLGVARLPQPLPALAPGPLCA